MDEYRYYFGEKMEEYWYYFLIIDNFREVENLSFDINNINYRVIMDKWINIFEYFFYV